MRVADESLGQGVLMFVAFVVALVVHRTAPSGVWITGRGALVMCVLMAAGAAIGAVAVTRRPLPPLEARADPAPERPVVGTAAAVRAAVWANLFVVLVAATMLGPAGARERGTEWLFLGLAGAGAMWLAAGASRRAVEARRGGRVLRWWHPTTGTSAVSRAGLDLMAGRTLSPGQHAALRSPTLAGWTGPPRSRTLLYRRAPAGDAQAG